MKCPHDIDEGKCLRCDHHEHDTTCWFCARRMKVHGVLVGNGPVHMRCKARAEKYWSDTQ